MPATNGKIRRDAFLYMENPRTPKFAQCDTCWLFAWDKGRCGILGPQVDVDDDDTCGYYLEGTFPDGLRIQVRATPQEVGFTRDVADRCENCRFAENAATLCDLYETLNKKMPDDFDLDSEIKPRGCCNAWKGKGSEE